MLNRHVLRARDLQLRNWDPYAIAREVARVARSEGQAAEAENEGRRASVTFFPSYETVELSQQGSWVQATARRLS